MSARLPLATTQVSAELHWFARGVEDGTREATCFVEAQEEGYWRCVAYYSCTPRATGSERAAYIDGFALGASRSVPS